MVSLAYNLLYLYFVKKENFGVPCVARGLQVDKVLACQTMELRNGSRASKKQRSSNAGFSASLTLLEDHLELYMWLYLRITWNFTCGFT